MSNRALPGEQVPSYPAVWPCEATQDGTGTPPAASADQPGKQLRNGAADYAADTPVREFLAPHIALVPDLVPVEFLWHAVGVCNVRPRPVQA